MYAGFADKAHRLQEREQSLTNWEQRLTVREAQLLERAWCPSCSAGVEGRDMSRTDDVEPTYPTRSPQDLKSVHFLFPTTTESPGDTVNRPQEDALCCGPGWHTYLRNTCTTNTNATDWGVSMCCMKSVVSGCLLYIRRKPVRQECLPRTRV